VVAFGFSGIRLGLIAVFLRTRGSVAAAFLPQKRGQNVVVVLWLWFFRWLFGLSFWLLRAKGGFRGSTKLIGQKKRPVDGISSWSPTSWPEPREGGDPH
jgi:hypothetical protein